MSFNFGNTNTGFPATSTAPTGFGLGAAPANKPAFGASSFSFGAPAGGSTVPSFGLGGTTTSSAPSFGFGNLPSSAPATTGFSGFGGGFGANSTATTTTLTTGSTFGTGTGFSGFGSAPTVSTQSTGFGFGSSFGQPATAPSGSLFSGFNQAATGFSSFGSTFGAKPAQTATTGVFGGFNSNLGGSTFGPTPQQQVPQNPNEAIYNSIFNCNVYGDERDTALSRWNLLQALWGTGKAYYSPSAPPVEISPHNPFCRFKAIGYSRLPTSENKEGLVAIIFNKTEADIRNLQQQLVASLNTVLGNKPNLVLTLEAIKPLSDTKAQVWLSVQEKGMTGVRKIPGVELTVY